MKNMDLSQLSSFGDFLLSIKSFCCNNIRSSMSEKDGFRIDMGMNAFRIIIIWFNLDVVNCELVSGFFHKNMNIVFFRTLGFNRIEKLPRRLFANLTTLQQL